MLHWNCSLLPVGMSNKVSAQFARWKFGSEFNKKESRMVVVTLLMKICKCAHCVNVMFLQDGICGLLYVYIYMCMCIY